MYMRTSGKLVMRSKIVLEYHRHSMICMFYFLVLRSETIAFKVQSCPWNTSTS